MSQSVIESLLSSCGQHPDRCAIEANGVTITYRSLVDRATAVAAFLKANGTSAGERVAIVLPNSIEYVVAYYGALMVNAIVVPMNTAAKAKDLAGWLEHSEAAWLFADAGNPEVAIALGRLESPPRFVDLGKVPTTTHCIDEIEGPEAGSSYRPPSAAQPATIIYTSGTTGRPKGVLLSHGNLASNAESIASYLRLRGSDSIVAVLPFFYSYGNSVLHSHLHAGARIILAENFVYPHVVIDTLARSAATGFAGVPSTYALLLSRVDLSQYDLSNLRYVTQAGGPMPPLLLDKLRAALPAAEVIAMYGQTEATARLTYLPSTDLVRKRGSVGLPLPGVRIEVRRKEGDVEAAGEVGEIWVQGPNVMLGYWRDPDATQSVLRDGWLSTGDMGYLDADGYLYLKGRRSDIVKVGAHRVHPQDIEEVVAEVPGVEEVAVVGVDDDTLGQVVKAFVVPAKGSELAPMAIRGFCRERLASYKVPKYVEFVESLPKTSSGKVRRAELVKEVG